MFLAPHAIPGWLQIHSGTVAGILSSLNDWMVSKEQPQDSSGFVDKAIVDSKRIKSVPTNIFETNDIKCFFVPSLYMK